MEELCFYLCKMGYLGEMSVNSLFCEGFFEYLG